MGGASNFTGGASERAEGGGVCFRTLKYILGPGYMCLPKILRQGQPASRKKGRMAPYSSKLCRETDIASRYPDAKVLCSCFVEGCCWVGTSKWENPVCVFPRNPFKSSFDVRASFK